MLDRVLADKLTSIAIKQIDAALKFKQPRMDAIKKNEDLYSNKSDPALPGQFSIPLPIMGGFVDSLLSELNQPVRINFRKQEDADLKKAKKVSAAWQYDSSPTRGAWNIKDIRAKKLAAISGRAIFKIFSESSPRYKNHLVNIHHYNFLCEPKGGADLNAHLFKGEMNYFKTKFDIESGVKSGIYDATQVGQAISRASEEGFKRNEDIYNNLRNTFAALGMNPDQADYAGEKVFSFTEWYMRYEGEEYYLFLEPTTGTWIRAEKLEDIFKKKVCPYVSWATHDDTNNFWSKAPADDVRPIAISLKEVNDQNFNNLIQRMRGKRAIDPNFFPNPAQLEDFTTRFVEATVPAGKSLGDGYVEFKTEDNTAITVNLMRFLNSFLGEKTGITPGSQGQAVEDKVGIYYGNIQQVARRMNLYSDFYKQAYAELGLRYLHGLQEHLRGKMAIQILGVHGYETDFLTREDTNFIEDPDIDITGGTDDQVINQAKQKEKAESLRDIIANPVTASQLNPKWLVEERLRVGGYDDPEIRRGMDLDTYGDQEIIAEAQEAIQEILKGKEPKKNRGANQAFLQELLNFATDEDLDPAIYDQIIAYFELHVPIARENAVRKARFMALHAPPGIPGAPGAPTPGLLPESKPKLSTASPQEGMI